MRRSDWDALSLTKRIARVNGATTFDPVSAVAVSVYAFVNFIQLTLCRCYLFSDYALLGKLKTHFPSIPVLAVTATASDRVRKDVCEILRIRHNYSLFRSTFQRPNLTYSVTPKVSKDGIAEMAAWIKSNHPHGAGIVYTYSRKDADTVASALCDCGVVAEVRPGNWHDACTLGQISPNRYVVLFRPIIAMYPCR